MNNLFSILAVALSLFLAVPAYAVNNVLTVTGSAIVFGADANLNPTSDKVNFTDDIGTDTVDCEMTFTSLADGAAHQSDKCDLGTPWAMTWHVYGVVDFTGETPTAGKTVDYYWCPSPDVTEAQSNVAGNDGADGAVPSNTVTTAITDAEFVKLCIIIGSLIVTDDATVQSGFVGSLNPPTEFGQLVILNSSGDAFEDNNIQAHTAFWPTIPQIQ